MEVRRETIGRMPVRTWRWLKVNDAEVELHEPTTPFDNVVCALRPDDEHISINREPVELPSELDGTGAMAPAAVRSFLLENANWRCHLRVADGHVERDPIVLEFRLDEAHRALVDDIIIEVGAGARATVIIRYTSPTGDYHHIGRTRLIAGQGASLTLVKVQMLGEGATHADTIGGLAQRDGEINVILAELGGANPLSGCNIELVGQGSRANLDLLYLGSGQRRLDLTTRIEHRGKDSRSDVNIQGVLAGDSRKVVRDTLDFLPGSSGSRGHEIEHVLLLSPTARNLSVPLLLCGEDDVEGEHAASSGRPDEASLFYLMTRGLSQTDAKKLLAQAAFAGVVERIPDFATQELIMNAVQAAVEEELA